MRRLEMSLPSARRLLLVDVALLVWSLTWVAMGIAVYNEARGLSELSATVREVGEAVEAFGASLGTVGELPVIGGPLGGALDEPSQLVQEAGRSARESSESARASIDALSALLGTSVALIPSLPLLILYLPARLSRFREAQAVGAAMRRSGADPAFREFLARRAAQNLSYRRLAEVTGEPWQELADGRFDRLADAELERLGVRERLGRQRGPR